MAVAYAHAVRYIGRPVWVLTKDGRRLHGIVHHVTPTHLYLRPFAPAPVGPVVRPMGAEGRTDVVPLGAASGLTTVDETQWGWGPYTAAVIALPLFVLLALGLLWI